MDIDEQRKKSSYLIIKEDDPKFPIPGLMNSERIVLIDGQIPPSKEFTLGSCTFGPKSFITPCS